MQGTMNINRLFAVPKYSTFGDIALLLLRLAAGAAFVMHGWVKIQHPFNWMGEHGFAPGPLQALAALSEFGGGLAWIAGLLTPLASLGVLCTMSVAVYTMAIMSHAPFVAKAMGPSFELPTVYFCIALVFIALGPGRLSADKALFGTR